MLLFKISQIVVGARPFLLKSIILVKVSTKRVLPKSKIKFTFFYMIYRCDIVSMTFVMACYIRFIFSTFEVVVKIKSSAAFMTGLIKSCTSYAPVMP